MPIETYEEAQRKEIASRIGKYQRIHPRMSTTQAAEVVRKRYFREKASGMIANLSPGGLDKLVAEYAIDLKKGGVGGTHADVEAWVKASISDAGRIRSVSELSRTYRSSGIVTIGAGGIAKHRKPGARVAPAVALGAKRGKRAPAPLKADAIGTYYDARYGRTRTTFVKKGTVPIKGVTIQEGAKTHKEALRIAEEAAKIEPTPIEEIQKPMAELQPLLPIEKLAGQQIKPKLAEDPSTGKIYDVSDPRHPVEIVPAESTAMRTWTAEELLHGKIDKKDVYTPPPWGVKGETYVPPPQWAQEKIITAKIAAFEELKDFLEPVTVEDVSKALSEGKPKAEVVKLLNKIDQDIINVPKAARAGKEAELKLLGVSAADIAIAKTIIPIEKETKEIKLPKAALKEALDSAVVVQIAKELPKALWESTKSEEPPPQGWQHRRTNKVITNEEYNKLPRHSAERDKYVRTVPEKVARGIKLASEILIPGVYTARHWDEMGAGGKAFSIALDVMILVPIGLAAVTAARSIGTSASIGRRLAMVGETLGRESLAQARAPIDIIIHPIESIKNVGRQVRGLYELVNDPSRLPSITLGTADGLVWFKVDKNTTKAEAMAIRDALVNLSKEGHPPVVIAGGKKYELVQAPIMKELKGGLVHATPDLAPFEQGTRVAYKGGVPLGEQGWFLSPGGAPRFAESSAFGKGMIPLPSTFDGKVREVAKFKANDLVRLDKKPVRPVDFANARNVPKDLAAEIQAYVKKTGGKIGGSFNQHLKVKGAPRPNDIDWILDNITQARKAQRDIIRIAKKAGYEARQKATTRSVEIKVRGKWKLIIDCDAVPRHDSMIPKELVQPTRNIEGFNFENLGEQYLRQSYGAIATTGKADKRLASIQKAADDVKNMLQKSGAEQRKPGFFVISSETAKKAKPTKKLYKGTAELEEKLEAGVRIPEPKQVLYTRIGPFHERALIMLEKPLTPLQINKLKAKGLIEYVKSPFKKPLKITKAKGIKGLSEADIKALSKTLRQSGNKRQAENLLRADRITRTQRVALAPRRAAPALARLMGGVRPARASTRVNKADITRLERARADVARVEARMPARPTREQARELGRARTNLERVRQSFIDRVTGGRIETTRKVPPRVPPPRGTPLRGERIKGEREDIRGERIQGKIREEGDRGKLREKFRRKKLKQELRRKILREKLKRERLREKTLKKTTGKAKGMDWSKEDIESAIAWKQGAVIHAIRAPYKSPDDVATFSVKNSPTNLQLLKPYIGKGSAAKSIKKLVGVPPGVVDIDMGFMDALVRRGGRGTVKLSFKRGSTTIGDVSVKKHHGNGRRRRIIRG